MRSTTAARGEREDGRGRDYGRALTVLASLIAALAVLVCLAALFWGGGGVPPTATSVRGERVELSGEGLYRYDTVFIAEGSRGTDVVTLFLGVPFLLVALLLGRRGSARAALLLSGALGYFLYVYASRALGNAYNGLFLAYITLFSASLFAFVLALLAVIRSAPVVRLTELPSRGPPTSCSRVQA